MYKVHELVSDLPKIAKHTDPNLASCGGLVLDNNQTLWVANSGHDEASANITHYDHTGHHLGQKYPFIESILTMTTPPTPKVQLISDLLWLQKTILYVDRGIIMPMPTIHTSAPVLGTAGNQPSSYEVSLNNFLYGPNGYLGQDIGLLIRRSVMHPNNNVNPTFVALLSSAHSVYLKILSDLHNPILIDKYGDLLIQAQDQISSAISLEETDVQSQEIQEKSESFPYPTFNPLLPIGLVYNPTRGFVHTYYKKDLIRVPDYLSTSDNNTSADIIAATSTGKIFAYHHLLNVGINYGFSEVINSRTEHAVYTGLTITDNNLYLADLANLRIKIFNYKWEDLVDMTENGFKDPKLPNNYSPFNVQAINHKIYVMYALLNMSDPLTVYDVVKGHGLGIINVFRPDGTFIKRLVTHKHLNAPWGLTYFDHKFFVGNHGNGRIHVYDKHWKYLGRLHFSGHEHHDVYNDHRIYNLFGLVSSCDEIYFSSRPKEVHGLLGYLTHKKD